MNNQRTNPYLKSGIILLLSAIGGAILGIVLLFIFSYSNGNIETGLTLLTHTLQSLILPFLICITILTVLAGEFTIKKLTYICGQILRTEDEECDIWEYEEEKLSAWGMNMNILSQVLCVIVLSAGYSTKYIETAAKLPFLWACIIFILCYIYDSFWQIRYIRLIQKTYPDKKGDPTSKKFQQQWLASCDEAEKQIIYQSAWHSYITLNKRIPLLLLITMLLHLFLDTGMLAIIIVAVIWLTITISYNHSCVKLRKEKISN